MAFAINKDRSVLNFGIMKSSGLAILDEAAIKIIQKAAKKFPPFPDGLGTEYSTLCGTHPVQGKSEISPFLISDLATRLNDRGKHPT